MNILFLANGTLSVAHQELAIAAALKKAGHDLIVVHDPESGFFNKGIIPAPLTKADIALVQHGDYRKVPARVTPDIIFGLDQSVAPYVLETKKHLNKPALCMFLDFPRHVVDDGSPPDYNPEYSARYYYWLSCAFQLDNIIFNNEVAVKEIFRRENKKTELVWYPLCNLDLITRTSTGSNLENPYVCSCHRFIHYKGTEYLIKALYGIDVGYKAISVSGNLEHQIVAYGETILGDNFVHIPKASEEEKLKIIAGALVFCYPQITGWIGGLSPLEAMALKVPVICFDFPVLRELYGDCVVYAKPVDVDDLQEKILYLLNNREKIDLDKAYNRVMNYFTPDVMAQKLIEVFNKYA